MQLCVVGWQPGSDGRITDQYIEGLAEDGNFLVLIYSDMAVVPTLQTYVVQTPVELDKQHLNAIKSSGRDIQK